MFIGQTIKMIIITRLGKVYDYIYYYYIISHVHVAVLQNGVL